MTMHTHAATLLAIMIIMIMPVHAQTETFRNDQGQQLGRADRHGNTTVFKDSQGRRLAAPNPAQTAR
jgi:hypothetical protein